VTLKAHTASEHARRVLGIDPGTTVTGWGLVSSDGHALARVTSGQLRLRGERASKLEAIFACVTELCAEYRPDAVSLEQSFVGDNIQTALRLGEARGAVMVAAARSGVAVYEYTPASIKMAVAGSGRADKVQMTAMVARLLALAVELRADEADALGAAICHINTSRFDARTAGAPAIGRRDGPPAGRSRSSRWR
jgi:crossover junction endodeoxyribonuclease RuvC